MLTMSRLFAVSAILTLGLVFGGISSTSMAGHNTSHTGATPPKGGLGSDVSGLPKGAGSGAVRTFIIVTIDNPNVLSPVIGGYQ